MGGLLRCGVCTLRVEGGLLPFFLLCRCILLRNTSAHLAPLHWVTTKNTNFKFFKPTARFNIQKFYVVITWNLCVLYGSRNKQQILPYKTLKDWFFKPRWRVLTARYTQSPYITQIRFVFNRLTTVKIAIMLPVQYIYCLFVCFLGVTTQCDCIFTAR